jgi:hypothetical protein
MYLNDVFPTSSNDCRSTILSDIPQSSCSSFSAEKTMKLKQTGRTRRERERVDGTRTRRDKERDVCLVLDQNAELNF